MDQLLGFCTSDYCRCVHAYRGGSSMISDVMFEEIISPAYYSSRLETPLNIIKSIFGDPKPWGTSPKGIKGREIFLNSEIFSEKYFRNLMGLFMCNVLHVRIEKLIVVDGIKDNNGTEIKIENHDNNENVTDTKKSGEKDVQKNVYENDKKSEFNKKNENENENENGNGNENENENENGKECKKIKVLKNYGAGLFTIYSMLNHSCECNTYNQGGDKAEVSLIASMDILKGKSYLLVN